MRATCLTVLCLLQACDADGPQGKHRPGSSIDAGAFGSDGGKPEPTVRDAGDGDRDGSGGSATHDDAGSPPVGRAGSMELISAGAPAWAAIEGNVLRHAGYANDLDPLTSWAPGAEPAWLAYDLSSVPASKRGQALVVWHALHAPDYLLEGVGTPGQQRPLDYTIEIHSAPGGGAPPSTGWSDVASVEACYRSSMQHLVDLRQANWVRIRVTKSSDPTSGPAIDFDVFSAPEGASDSWLFMGDSITFMSMSYPWCDVPGLVRQQQPTRFPPTIDAAIGGTNTGTALASIDATLQHFVGKYVVLAYGTNDHAGADFRMEELVQSVLDAGKVPVVPRMPWSEGSTEGQAINAQIEALYTKYPQIVRGPDLWALFEGRTDLIPFGDVHPNEQGAAALRAAWAEVIASVP